MSKDDNPNVTLGEQADMIEQSVEVELSEHLREVRDQFVAAFSDAEVVAHRGELTLVVGAEQIHAAVKFARDDELLAAEMLADLSGVHWPGGTVTENAQETTGWPTYETERDGSIEVDYLMRSVTELHSFRIRTSVSDENPEIASVTDLYAAAAIMENEVYDFFGVVFTGHPDLKRILMPEDWDGFPHRKDYPLGGVEVEYKGALIPPPDERSY